MTLTSIFNKVKPGLVKGVKPIDLLNDLQATAWQYAYDCLKGKKVNDGYNDLFMNHYTQALKTLRKAMVK
jgi:hypothetical protein